MSLEYDPALDPVAAIVLTVECAPGQVDAIVDYLRGVKTQAGVYAAVVQVVGVTAPKDDTVEVEPVSEPPTVEPAVVEVEAQPKEQANGEQAIQRVDLEPEAAAVGDGKEAAPAGVAESVGDGEPPIVAEPAGEVPEGSVERGP